MQFTDLKFIKFDTIEKMDTGDVDKVFKIKRNTKTYILKLFNNDIDQYANARFLREEFIYNNSYFKDIVPKLKNTYTNQLALELEYVQNQPLEISYFGLTKNIYNFLTLTNKYWEVDHRILPKVFQKSSSISNYGKKKAMLNMDYSSMIKDLKLKNINSLFENITSMKTHPQNIVLIHGDLHLRNILEDMSKNLLLIDWGRSRIADLHYDLGYFVYRTSCGQFQSALSIKQTKELIEKITHNYTGVFAINSEQIWNYYLYTLYFDYFWWKSGTIKNGSSANIVQYCSKLLKKLDKQNYKL